MLSYRSDATDAAQFIYSSVNNGRAPGGLVGIMSRTELVVIAPFCEVEHIKLDRDGDRYLERRIGVKGPVARNDALQLASYDTGAIINEARIRIGVMSPLIPARRR